MTFGKSLEQTKISKNRRDETGWTYVKIGNDFVTLNLRIWLSFLFELKGAIMHCKIRKPIFEKKSETNQNLRRNYKTESHLRNLHFGNISFFSSFNDEFIREYSCLTFEYVLWFLFFRYSTTKTPNAYTTRS